ncbi:MAG: hypothetical protein AMJ55_13010 [Gammaproteobacteria bacterium SG8_15]|jgi:hypothetical protein|nr:MAG: hypothetical protein AMJ55_13010 [Gammaproteobacteria bacterium SG8_15]
MGSQFRIKAIFFALTFILAQSIIIFAEFDHPLHEPDSSCNICLAAGHLSNGLVSVDLTIQLHAQPVYNDRTSIHLFIQSLLTAYNVRAPPLL